jgi:hypothetical protein
VSKSSLCKAFYDETGKLLNAWERLPDDRVPPSLQRPLLQLEALRIRYKDEANRDQFVPTAEAVERLGVAADALHDRVASERFILGKHYLLWNEPGQRGHYSWNVQAIRELMALPLAKRRPLKRAAIA